jgi:hypothetical protein
VKTRNSIQLISKIYADQRQSPLPNAPGIYAFWWLGDKDVLLQANRQMTLKGPGEKPVTVEYGDWWPKELKYPCLYVGKTTKIKNRFSMHIRNGTNGRMHKSPNKRNDKIKPKTTSCQLRFGIEHVFKHEADPLKLIHENVGFSYEKMNGDNAIVERFFKEDLLIGKWRPWFNIDSER